MQFEKHKNSQSKQTDCAHVFVSQVGHLSTDAPQYLSHAVITITPLTIGNSISTSRKQRGTMHVQLFVAVSRLRASWTRRWSSAWMVAIDRPPATRRCDTAAVFVQQALAATGHRCVRGNYPYRATALPTGPCTRSATDRGPRWSVLGLGGQIRWRVESAAVVAVGHALDGRHRHRLAALSGRWSTVGSQRTASASATRMIAAFTPSSCDQAPALVTR